MAQRRVSRLNQKSKFDCYIAFLQERLIKRQRQILLAATIGKKQLALTSLNNNNNNNNNNKERKKERKRGRKKTFLSFKYLWF